MDVNTLAGTHWDAAIPSERPAARGPIFAPSIETTTYARAWLIGYCGGYTTHPSALAAGTGAAFPGGRPLGINTPCAGDYDPVRRTSGQGTQRLHLTFGQ